jgi:COP9 signalosome complex subunit 1
LNGNEPHVLLNPFLSPHTRILIQQITTRAIIQYVTPFSTVQMGVMASAFDMPEEKMLGEVERLVEEGKIKARIDLIDYVGSLAASRTSRC